MQKYNLQKKSSKRNQDPSRYHNSITNLKFQHKPKYRLSKILIVKHPILDQHWLELCVHPSMNNLIFFFGSDQIGFICWLFDYCSYLLPISFSSWFWCLGLDLLGVTVGILPFFFEIFLLCLNPEPNCCTFVFCICVVGCKCVVNLLWCLIHLCVCEIHQFVSHPHSHFILTGLI